MRYCIIIALVFFSNITIGQTVFKAQVVDGYTKLGIPSVNIVIEGTELGVVSDAQGKFEIPETGKSFRLLLTHVGYDDRIIDVESINEKREIIILYPSNKKLTEVTIAAQNDVVSLSDVDSYTVVDFEISNDLIYQLEYHDMFQKYKLAVTDLEGSVLMKLNLKNLKKVEELIEICTGSIYVLCENHGYQVIHLNQEIILGEAIPVNEFNDLISPCKLNKEEEIYFVRARDNGLVQEIVEYSKVDQSYKLLKVISEPELVEGYHRDASVIAAGQGIISATTSSFTENRKIRGLQEESDFLLHVFYKPSYPVYVGNATDGIYIYNHIEGKIEAYVKGILQNEIPINYVEDKQWMKVLCFDKVDDKVYGLFRLKSGLGLKEIDEETGATSLSAVVETFPMNFNDIRIYGHSVYYLDAGLESGTKVGLMKFEF